VKLIQDPLAVKLLSGEFQENSVVQIDAKGEHLTFEKGKLDDN
jgi:ATP-dependent Clp protease ATP-binding subunit ClpA